MKPVFGTGMRAAFLLGMLLPLFTDSSRLVARERSERWRDWANVATLQADRPIVVKLRRGNRPKKVKGKFVSSPADEIVLRTGKGLGVVLRLHRNDVRKVTARRRVRRLAPLIGTVIGVATIGALLSSFGTSDLTALGHAMWLGIGAGLGSLGGLAVRAVVGPELVYLAEKGRITKSRATEPRSAREKEKEAHSLAECDSRTSQARVAAMGVGGAAMRVQMGEEL